MRRILKSPGLILIAIFLVTGSVSAGEEGAYALEDLNWILGSWQMDGRSSTIIETWKEVSESTYEGESYTISLVNNDTTFAESLRIVEMSGEIYYIADVSHNPYPVPFKLAEQNGKGAVFENEGHDFPQRIEYSVTSTKALAVIVSGTDKSSNREKTLEFHYKKKE
jgi:hypothetical protein